MRSVRSAAFAALLAILASVDGSAANTSNGPIDSDGGTAGGENSAGELAERCRDPIRSDDAFGSGFCIGFIRGARDMALILDKVIPDEHRSCVPEGVTTGQLAKVFVHWAENHPEQLHVPAVVGVHRSIVAAFPCRSRAAR